MVKLFSKEGGAQVSITGEDPAVERLLVKYGYVLGAELSDEAMVEAIEAAEEVVEEAPTEVVEEAPKKKKKRVTKKASKV